MATMQDIINGFKDPRTLKMPLSNTPEFNNPSPLTTFPLSGRPVQSVPFPKLDRSQPHTVNYWPTYGANDPSGGVPYLPAPMPKPMGVANAPGIGNYAPYGPTPNTGGDPNRLQPGGLPFINRPPLDITVRGGAPQTASVPMPQGRPGLNIQPFDQQFNLRDPGNEGYVDPVAAYAPPAPAATTAGRGQPQTSVLQDIMTGINSLLPSNAPKPLAPGPSYDAANAAAAERARTQDRSGFGTDGYVRDASGNVIGRDGQYKGLSPEDMYNQISGRPTDDSWKSTFSRDQGLEAKLRGTGVSVDQYMQGRRDGTYSGLGDVRGNALRNGMAGMSMSGGGAAGPVTAGPIQAPRSGSFSGGGMQQPVTAGQMQRPVQSIAPVTGGIMAPAQRRRAPIMRSA